MATSTASSENRSDWVMEISIGLGILILGVGAWLFNTYAKPQASNRPVPIWLGISKVMAQMTDGRMLSVKVNLQLKNKDDQSILEPHATALKAVVEQVAADMNEDEITGPDAMVNLGDAIESGVNDYLREQHLKTRIKHVMFDEMVLMP